MEDGVDLAVEMAGLDARDEVVLVEVIGDVAIDEIAELVGPGQVVDGDDVLHAALVERLDEVGTDKSGRAGNDDVHETLLTGPRPVPGG